MNVVHTFFARSEFAVWCVRTCMFFPSLWMRCFSMRREKFCGYYYFCRYSWPQRRRRRKKSSSSSLKRKIDDYEGKKLLYGTYLNVLYFSFVRSFALSLSRFQPTTHKLFKCKEEIEWARPTTTMCYLKFKKRASKRLVSCSYAIESQQLKQRENFMCNSRSSFILLCRRIVIVRFCIQFE